MDLSVLGAMSLVLLCWGMLGAVFVGLGRLVGRLLGGRHETPPAVASLFWFGFALAIALLQVWHIWRPVDIWAVLLLGSAGLAGWLMDARSMAALVRRRATVWLLLAWMLAIFLVANRSIQPVWNYDTGLYHLPTVKWFTTYPLVPGLGNLHTRLAFNSSYFLYGALIESLPLSVPAYHVAGGLLVSVLLLQLIGLAGSALFSNTPVPRQVLGALLLGPALLLALGPDISSLSPDIAVTVLGMVIGLELADAVTGRPAAGATGRQNALMLAALAALGITMKVNFLFIGAASLVVALPLMGWRKWLRDYRGAAVTGVLLLVGVWVMRGVILSGYAAFPSGWGAFDVPWRVPAELRRATYEWIMSWARGRLAPGSNALQGGGWLRAWFAELPVAAWLPAAIGLGCGALAVAGSRKVAVDRRLWLLPLPALLAIACWFLTAPAPRFAGAAFWLFAAALAVVLLSGVRRTGPDGHARPGAVRVAFVVFMAAAGFSVVPVPDTPVPKQGLFPVLPMVDYRARVTPDGLKVFTPVGSDQCWNLYLPCTPEYNPQLRLRKRGNLSGGFFIDPRVNSW